MRNQDTFRGCLLGGAAGDALGYAVEFESEGRIFSRFGEKGITEYALTNGCARISDDTQMTLFTAAGLLAGEARKAAQSLPDPYRDAIRDSYLDWLRTQRENFPPKEKPLASWLLNVPELFSPRAPGGTCLAALQAGGQGTTEKPANNKKGCGGVMRVAPIGLYFNDRNVSSEFVARLGAEAAAVTHGHPLGWLPAAALAQIVHEISQNGDSVYDAVMKTLYTQENLWPESKDKEYFLALTNRAVDLAGTNKNDLDAIHQLGEGWVAEETLAVAVYCALKHENDFDRALIASVNHKGDSDSTGAVTGNILGARLGLKGIPEKYLTNLELKDLILEVADDLYKYSGPGKETDPAFAKKYLEMTWPEKA